MLALVISITGEHLIGFVFGVIFMFSLVCFFVWASTRY